LAFKLLYPHNVGKLSTHMPRYDLKANALALSYLRSSMLLGLSNLIPSTRHRTDPRCGRTKRISKGYVRTMGEQLLYKVRIPFDELAYGTLTLLKYLLKIIYGGHL